MVAGYKIEVRMKLCWGKIKLKKREAKRMRRRDYCITLHNNSVWSLIYSNIISDRRTQHNTTQHNSKHFSTKFSSILTATLLI